ncbi:hypothetical protein [Niveispirillum sp. BGYR6]|uniref:hypothetical protein n=1 Tax=Niveispirillum sp. BGYR6 TaxID=2971249 RepID=UPI0022B976A7|nr:hypothetical protein [Niveispirillum sp. BGYR6]MDG5493459.1 hypothetical protein [Niveispirillum sp. BGYR6]
MTEVSPNLIVTSLPVHNFIAADPYRQYLSFDLLGKKAPEGFKNPKIAFYANLDSHGGTFAPVYQFSITFPSAANPVRFSYALSPTPSSGWTNDGVAFYAWADPRPGSIPVYRFKQILAGGLWNVVVQTSSTAPDGFQPDGIAFFAIAEG